MTRAEDKPKRPLKVAKPYGIRKMPKTTVRRVTGKIDPKQFFPILCEQRGLPKPECEYPFAQSQGRRWRFDFCWPDESLALEVDGGIWTQGRHTRGSGWLKDTEKLNLACTMGWRMLRCTPQQLCTSEMLDTIKRALNYNGNDEAHDSRT